MTANMKTRSIDGRLITLTMGERYLASRPMGCGEITTVTVRHIDVAEGDHREPDHVISGLTYDQANAFLTAFNNGKTSFEGRVW